MSGVASPKCAAVCIDTRDGAGRRRLHGVAQFAQRHDWRMMLVRRRGEEAAREVVQLRPQGIITYIAGEALVDTAKRLSVPLVDTAISEVDVPVQDALVEAAPRYAHEHAGQAIGVEHIARAVGVSRRTLDRRFTQALGRSVHEELSAVRMQNACVLLAESHGTAAEIAAACGFGTAASFSRAFHRRNGCGPIEYRKRLRG